MSAIRTFDDLEDALSEQVAWRRTELHSILAQIRAAQQCSIQAKTALCRAGVALLYAHWEGFAKFALATYVRYVAKRGLPDKELHYAFVAMSVEAQLRRAGDMTQTQLAIERVRRLMEESQSRALIPTQDPINTRSNLNSEVCSELLSSLGLNNFPFATRSHLIDYKLLKARNEIAHGEYLPIDPIDYEDLHVEVLELIQTFQRIVISAVENRSYRRSGT